MRQDEKDKLKDEILMHILVHMDQRFHLVPKIANLKDGTCEEYLGAALKFVCEAHNITFEEISSRSRRQRIVFPRQIFCYIVRRYFGNKIPFQRIGKYIHQDHATVMHAVKHVQNIVDTDKFDRAHVNDIYMDFQRSIREMEFRASLEKLKETA